MIRRLEHDGVASPREGTSEAQRELVRLTRRIHEEDDAIAERGGQGRRQSRRILVRDVACIASVRVQHRHLCLSSADYARMAVSNMRHVVISIEIAAAD